MNSFRVIALVATLLWLLGVLVVGCAWMSNEYSLITKDNEDGTVTFRDGPDLAVQTKQEFFVEAVKNTSIIVLVFPTSLYVTTMLVLFIVWLLRRRDDTTIVHEEWK